MEVVNLDDGLLDHLKHLGVLTVFSVDGRTVDGLEKTVNCSLTNREVRFIIGAWNCSKGYSNLKEE